MKKKALLSSILTIALCLSLIAGSTFALFTSESSVNIAVTSGTVKVTATIDDTLQLYTPKSINESGVILDATNTAGDGLFGNRGTAAITNGNQLTLTNMVPGDSVTATIKIKNESNVSIKYRTILKSVGDDNSLLPALKVTFGEAESEPSSGSTSGTTTAKTFNGATVKDEWVAFEGNNEKSITVKIELIGNAGDGYQNKTCQLAFTVEAVQGNAEMPDEWDGTTVTTLTADEDGVYHISTAAEFVEYMNSINKNDGKHYYKVVLDRDIDLGGYTYEVSGAAAAFSGSFDGQNHTVSNYVIKRADNDECHYTGLFSIQSYAQDGRTTTIENLTVKNGTVIAKSSNQVSAIAPNMEANGSIMKNCHAIDCTVIGHKKVGAITGYVVTGSTIENCSATNCNVIATAASEHTEADKQNATIYGYNNGGTFTNNAEPIDCVAVSGVDYIISTAEELREFAASVNSYNSYEGKTVVLANDIDLNNVAWTPIGMVTSTQNNPYFRGTFDGLGHTISNLNVDKSATDTELGYTTAGLFGWIDAAGTTIKNVNIDGATVKSNHFAGALVGYLSGTIENCHVTNANVISVHKDNYNDGGKVGGLVGYMNSSATVENSSVSNSSVIGKRDVGGLVGCTSDNTCTVTGNEVSNTTVTYSDTNGAEIVGRLDGQRAGNPCVPSNTTATNVTVVSGATYVANGVTTNAAGEYLISNAQGLVYCATTFTCSDTTLNKVFKLAADIDMAGIEWTPWCNEAQYFNGLFDGQNHTISNLTIDDEHTAADGHAVGFIGRLGANGLGEKTIKNVTFDNANVSGHHYVGVAVGYNEYGTVDNVKVTNSRVTATHVEGADSCGDKAGAVVGFVGASASNGSVNNCSATNCEVKAARDAGQIVGAAKEAQVSNCAAVSVSVSVVENSICNDGSAGQNIRNEVIGRVL